MIHKKILAFLLCSTVPVLSLHAGGYEFPYNGPKDALEYYKNGGIVDVFPLGPSFGWDTFPKELLEIPTLEELDLGLSDPTIPEEIVKLNKLRKLRIVGGSKNLILPKSMAKMKKFKYLSIEDANIENLEQVCTYTQIETLELKSMGLKKLPECIGQLMNLKKLNLEGNNLETLPSSIVNLINTDIDLSSTPLSEKSGFSYLNLKLPHAPKVIDYYNTKVKPYISDFQGLPEAYTVSATSGLSVRNKPKLKAKKIGVMPHRLKIAVYGESSKTETIDGITAPWMRIKALANGQYMQGWAWAGYLEKYKYEEDYPLRFQELVAESYEKRGEPNFTLDTKRIRFFIKNGVDIDTRANDSWPYGLTLLEIVAYVGNIKDFRFLLENGASVTGGWSIAGRTDIGLESKKAFFSVLQDYAYDFKANTKGLLQAAIHSSFECYLSIEEVGEQSSELLEFLKEILDVESVSETLAGVDIRTCL